MSVRIGREDWSNLQPEDVAWVTEWQLASAFPWVPIGPECRVFADPEPDVARKRWRVCLMIGQDRVIVELPLRDLARLIQWCHQVNHIRTLLHPPAWVRASILALQRTLRRGLTRANPLDSMGYSGGEARGSDRGGSGRP
jgi:hypothetical protein